MDILSSNKILNNLWGNLIIEELLRNGVNYFCIAPGSRSTPIAAGAARNRNAQKIVCYDERAAAYHALGYGLAKGRPAAVIVTSGTAVANLLPAAVEASQSRIPLIFLSADRPFELLEVGANQAINQIRILGEYAKWFFNFPCPDLNISPRFVLSNIDLAVNKTREQPCGPVHLNFMFREPLEPFNNDDFKFDLDLPQIYRDYLKNIINWQGSSRPFRIYKTEKLKIDLEDQASQAAKAINDEKKGLLVIGRLTNQKDIKSALEIVLKSPWPVYADIQSGLRLSSACGSSIIKHFDNDLMNKDFLDKVKPENIIHIGDNITSKRYGQFLKKCNLKQYIQVSNSSKRYDPDYLVTIQIEADISDFCGCMGDRITINQENDFKKLYIEKEAQSQAIIEKNLSCDTTLSEVFLSRYISSNIEDNSCLFLSSSMPIRDMELYGKSGSKNIITASNRGASGIDGVIASAAGFANARNSICNVLLGDLAFIYDLNSLSILKKINAPLIIIVINNRGGGIFDFLPISECKDIFEDYFAAPHDFNFKGAAEMFNIDYFLAETRDDFADSYSKASVNAKKNNKSAIIEAATKREDNFNLRKKIKEEILNIF